MNEEILKLMDKRRETGDRNSQKYKQILKEILKTCSKAKERCYEER